MSKENVESRLAEAVEKNTHTGIVYNREKGSITLNELSYDIGKKSFTEVANIILGTLKKLYGEYQTIPYTFNQETYENQAFKANVLALGGQGILEFNVYKK